MTTATRMTGQEILERQHRRERIAGITKKLFCIALIVALVICIIGNVIPVPFVILFGRWTLDFLGQTKAFGSIVTKYKAKVMSKSDVIHKYGPWGLLLFVGIPLPGTGAWTGSVLALLMNLRMREAVPAILLGVVMAGVIMTLGSHGLLGIFELL